MTLVRSLGEIKRDGSISLEKSVHEAYILSSVIDWAADVQYLGEQFHNSS